MLLRVMLAIVIVLMPNLLYLAVDTGVPGLNTATVLLLLLVTVLLFSRRNDQSPSMETGLLTPPLLFWFLTLVIGFFIAQWTKPMSLMGDLTHLKNVVFYPLLYFVYRRCGQDIRGTRQLIYLTMAVAVAAGVDALIEGLSFDIGSFSDQQRAAGPFGGASSSNRAGVFFAMFLPLLFAVALFLRGHKLWRLAASGGSVILLIAIVLTYSRQAYLIALVSMALLLVRRNLVLASMLAVLTIPGIALLPDSVTQRVTTTEQQDAIGGSQLDSSTESRFEIWAGAWEMWKQYPAGVGLKRFEQRIGEFSQHEMRDAHSIYVLTLAELGPLGVLALLWLLWRLLKLGLALRGATNVPDAETQVLGLGFLVAILAMALGNVFGTPFMEGLVMANFWILCGLVERYVMLKRSEGTVESFATASDTGRRIGSRFPLAARVMPGRYRAASE